MNSTIGIIFQQNDVCPLGCSASVHHYAQACGTGEYEKRIFTIWQCDACGIGFTDPIPTRDSAHLLYEEREDSAQFQIDDSTFISRLKSASARKDARRFCRGANPTGDFLDYGCGDGAFVRAIEQVFPTARVIGADLHSSPPMLLSPDSYLTYDELRPQSFDFILCRHVLEHTYDPVKFLHQLKILLRPAGIIGIEVPSLETPVRLLFGKHWDNYYAPYHPLHFTKGSLRQVIESAGMTVTGESGAEMPKMGRSLRNVIGCNYNLALFTAGIVLQPLQVTIGIATQTNVCLRAWAESVHNLLP